jgi:nicotinate-nucleotide pyrophosphorylase (carboxylating)
MRDLSEEIVENVRAALAEDVGTGDITAQLLPADAMATAQVITREKGILCGTAWFEEVFKQLDPNLQIEWFAKDGDIIQQKQTLVKLSGLTRALLTGERAALNFIQLLSGVSSKVAHYVEIVKNTEVILLDTRKTIPMLRRAQKYAVKCGGGQNHRLGLYDAFLIKENHIAAAGSITAAVQQARTIAPDKPVEVEVEDVEQLKEALAVNAEIVLLDNFNLYSMREAVRINEKRAKLEASGGVTVDKLLSIAETGVDYISIGGLTKDVKALDLSMRLVS